jgi:hypothetical protein
METNDYVGKIFRRSAETSDCKSFVEFYKVYDIHNKENNLYKTLKFSLYFGCDDEGNKHTESMNVCKEIANAYLLDKMLPVNKQIFKTECEIAYENYLKRIDE